MNTLSIILPIHNASDYLKQNVNHLVEILPTLTNAFQIIIVDDGSTDGSDDIAAELERRFPQVATVFHAHQMGEKTSIESAMKKVCYPLTFVQATQTIEEKKIRQFIEESGRISPLLNRRMPILKKVTALEEALNRVDQPIAVCPFDEELKVEIGLRESFRKDSSQLESVSPQALATDSSQVDTTSSQQADQIEQRLVERLMEWGIALREYRRQFDSDPEGITELESNDSPDEDQQLKTEPIEISNQVNASPANVAAPKFSSIPEQRLTRLSRHDLDRYAAGTRA